MKAYTARQRAFAEKLRNALCDQLAYLDDLEKFSVIRPIVRALCRIARPDDRVRPFSGCRLRVPSFRDSYSFCQSLHDMYRHNADQEEVVGDALRGAFGYWGKSYA